MSRLPKANNTFIEKDDNNENQPLIDSNYKLPDSFYTEYGSKVKGLTQGNEVTQISLALDKDLDRDSVVVVYKIVTSTTGAISQEFVDPGSYTLYISTEANANIDSSFTSYNDIPVEEFDTDQFFADEEFLEEYNKALNDNQRVRFNFGNAYADALEIVNTRKSSIYTIIDRIQAGLEGLVDKISPVITEENLNKLAKISDDVAKGDLSAESVLKAIGK